MDRLETTPVLVLRFQLASILVTTLSGGVYTQILQPLAVQSDTVVTNRPGSSCR